VREIVFDTETTGLNPIGGDRIIEIAAIEILDDKITDNKFNVYIDPERDVPDSAFRVHGISREFLINKPIFNQIIDKFLIFIGNDPIIAHNAEFDLNFLNEELRRAGRPPLENNLVIDTLALARQKHPGAANSLDALCARYGIDRSRRTKHGALIDTEILAEVYLELKCGRQKSLSFSVQKEARKLDHAGLLTIRMQSLIHELNFDDDLRHQEYIGSWNGKALWEAYGPKTNGQSLMAPLTLPGSARIFPALSNTKNL
jgi:DNA polymerase III subunit epsilon